MNKESVKAKFSENNITLKLVPAISRKCHKIIEPAWSLRGQVKVDQNGRILKVFKLPKHLIRQLKQHIAADEDTTVIELVEQAIKDFISRRLWKNWHNQMIKVTTTINNNTSSGAVNLSNHLFIVIINKKIKPIFNMI
jgi:uncharacterized protein (DUF2164 family)